MNFYQLHEKLINESHSDDEIFEVIQIGLNLDAEFWNNFLLLLNNSTGLAKLFDLPSYKISAWRMKVTAALEKYHKTVANEDKQKKNKILKTGDL